MKLEIKESINKYFKYPETMDIGSIILANPKYAHNVGQAYRMTACFCVPQLWCSGDRILEAVTQLDRIPREERMRGYKDTELCWHEDPLSLLPENCTPVAVEFMPNAEDLSSFVHPKNPIYIFGPEDGSLDRRWLTKCHKFVKIDSAHCLNLSTACGILLYDRDLKEKCNVSKKDNHG